MIGVFKKVTLSFLLQGHTHADVDQLFVGISKKYTRTILWTLQDLFDLMPTAYPSEATRPSAMEMPFMFNQKDYFNPVLLPLQGHAGPHVYVFSRSGGEQVLMAYKDYHSSTDVLRGGDEGNGIRVLSGVPQGRPDALIPKPLTPMEITETRQLFRMTGFPEEAKETWERLLTRNSEPPPIPDDYFNFELYKLPEQAPLYAHVPVTPTGFEIVNGGQIRAPASEVF